MTEAAFARKVMKKLQEYPGCFPVRIQPGPYGAAGKTDIILCFWGFFIAIELKFGKGKPSRLQEKFMKDVINKGNGQTLVAWKWEEIQDFLDNFRRRNFRKIFLEKEINIDSLNSICSVSQ